MGGGTAAVSALPHRNVTAEETSGCSDWPIFSAGEESDDRKTPQRCIVLHCIILHYIMILYCIILYQKVSVYIVLY